MRKTRFLRLVYGMVNLWLLFVVFSPAEAIAQTAPIVAIVGGQLIDGHGSPPTHRSVVIVEGKRLRPSGAKERFRFRQARKSSMHME